jgi:hypothetical protein
VTVPPRPGFVPPAPYPHRPPFEQAWYGTPELWTILDAKGAVWSDLPVGEGSRLIWNKTLWFSDDFSTAEDEDFSGDAEITVTAADLDGSAPMVVQQGGVPSFNRDIKNFILVGLASRSRDAGRSPPRTTGSSSRTYFWSRTRARRPRPMTNIRKPPFNAKMVR